MVKWRMNSSPDLTSSYHWSVQLCLTSVEETSNKSSWNVPAHMYWDCVSLHVSNMYTWKRFEWLDFAKRLVHQKEKTGKRCKTSLEAHFTFKQKVPISNKNDANPWQVSCPPAVLVHLLGRSIPWIIAPGLLLALWRYHHHSTSLYPVAGCLHNDFHLEICN